MKQLAELDKIDPGEEENDDKDEDEELEEVIYPQKVTFVLGAVQGKPLRMNEFFWIARTPHGHHNTGKDAPESAHNS